MRRRIVGLRTQSLRERGACPRQSFAIQRFERGTPLDKGSIGSEQCVQRRV
jgi:hypothetical protein